MTVALAVIALVLPLAGYAISQAGTPEIRFLNPSNHSTIVSDETVNPGGDATYRLAAWVKNVPANPIVEFELVDGALTQTYTATRVGSSDTWEYQWSIPLTTVDGPYTIRAILYSGLNEVSRHEQEITISNGSDLPPANKAARVEFVSPANGGSPGFYTPPQVGGTPNTLVTIAKSASTIRTRIYYTTTQAGNEPTWKLCGTGTGTVIRCTLTGTDQAAAVSALAAVANTTPNGPAIQDALDAAGDAIRIQNPYTQVPTTLTITGNEAPNTEAGICSPVFTVNVKDQLGQNIAGANVDVMAKGPTDQLYFNTGGSSSGAQPPDQGGHTDETAYNCTNSTFTGLQGEHNRPGDSDIKNIESTSGTGDTGNWTFRLLSPSPGTTQITAWADRDNNDIYCSTEPNDSFAMAWTPEGGPAEPIPATQPIAPETTSCTGTFSPPPTATASPTTTASPTATATPTATPSATPSASPSATPAQTPATVTLEPTSQDGSTGTTEQFVATVRDSNGQTIANEAVDWSTSGVGTIVGEDGETDANGQADVVLQSTEEGTQTITAATPRCALAATCTDSSAVQWTDETTVTEHGRSVKITGFKVLGEGNKVLVKGSVNAPSFAGCESGVPVKLARKANGKWITRKSGSTKSSGKFKLRTRNISGRYRVTAPQIDITDQQGDIDRCRKATRVKRYRGGN